LAVAEAIMYGTKVVCTDSGGIRDFVNDKNGIVVGLNNVEELVEAVQKVLENSKVSQSESQVLCEQYGSKQYREKMFASYIK
jgi:glycosyltransferase involved in cell wall biosynthesis